MKNSDAGPNLDLLIIYDAPRQDSYCQFPDLGLVIARTRERRSVHDGGKEAPKSNNPLASSSPEADAGAVWRCQQSGSVRGGASLHAFVPCLAWTYCVQLYFGDRLMVLLYQSTATRQQLSSYPQPSYSHHVLSRLRLVLHFPPRSGRVPAGHRGRGSDQSRSRDTDERICGVHNWGKFSQSPESRSANNLYRMLASLNPRRHTKSQPSLSFRKGSRLTALKTSLSLGCVSLSDRILNTRKGADLLIAATHCFGMDATTSRARTSASGRRIGLSTHLIL